MSGTTRTQDIDTPLGLLLFTLDSERYHAFVHALENPPAPGPKLKALLQRVPAWARHDRAEAHPTLAFGATSPQGGGGASGLMEACVANTPSPVCFANDLSP